MTQFKEDTFLKIVPQAEGILLSVLSKEEQDFTQNLAIEVTKAKNIKDKDFLKLVKVQQDIDSVLKTNANEDKPAKIENGAVQNDALIKHDTLKKKLCECHKQAAERMITKRLKMQPLWTSISQKERIKILEKNTDFRDRFTESKVEIPKISDVHINTNQVSQCFSFNIKSHPGVLKVLKEYLGQYRFRIRSAASTVGPKASVTMPQYSDQKSKGHLKALTAYPQQQQMVQY